jgi:hypothetical protein
MKIVGKYAEYAKQYAKYVISSHYDICERKYAKYVIKYAKYAQYAILKKLCRICTPHFADDGAAWTCYCVQRTSSGRS